jgi:hypothetical protein
MVLIEPGAHSPWQFFAAEFFNSSFVHFFRNVWTEAPTEEDRIAPGIAPHVLHRDFVDDAVLTCPAVIAPHVGCRAQGPEPDFARCISTKQGAILREYNAQAFADGSNRTADTCQAATNADKIRVYVFAREETLPGLEFIN